jgi:hypothetical protein
MFDIITKRRCDKSMRRSKEKGYKLTGQHWKCPGDCRGCVCCIEKDQEGNERHAPYGRRHE